MYAYDYSQDPQFSGLFKKLSRATRKIRHKIAKTGLTPFLTSKAQKKAGHVLAGSIAAFGVPPKVLGVKNRASQYKVSKYAKRFRVAGAVVLGGAALMMAGPAIGGFLAKGGSMAMKGITFAGGKLKALPMVMSKFLKSKGQDPATASIEQILEAGTQTGILNDTDIARMANTAEFTQPVSPSIIPYPQQQELLQIPISQARPVMAGMMPSGIGGLPKNTIMIAMLGVSVVGLLMQSKK